MDTTEYKGYTIEIAFDDIPESPRDWDNLGTMVCWHRRANYGDIQPNETPREYLENYLLSHLPAYHPLVNRLDTLEFSRVWAEFGKFAFILPIYAYEHSGITISTSRGHYPFNDAWDSGQLGFIYVEKSKVREEWKCKRISTQLAAKVYKNLEAEVETYDQYLTGQVFGYIIHGADDLDGESCWGFYGYDYCKEEAKSIIDSHVKRLESAAWENVPLEAVEA